MSQILSRLNSLKNKLNSSVKAGKEALRSSSAPTPLLKASVKTNARSAAHRHKFSAVLRWLVGNAGQVPALAKLLVTAAFFGSLMLVMMSIFLLPSPRKKIQPPQNVRTSPANFFPKPEATRAPAAIPSPIATQATAPTPTSNTSPAPAPSKVATAPQKSVAPVAPTAPAAPAPPPQPLATIPASVLEKIKEGQTPQERQKTALQFADEFLKEKKRDLAIALLERVTGENPSWIDALFLLSSEYRKADKLDASSGTLLRILQVDPKHALSYNNLGMIQMRKKNPKDAIPYFEKAFALEKTSPELALNLGIAYEQTLIWGKAVTSYEHYLQLTNPSGAPSKDKVINAVKFRMQRLRAFARAQGTLEPQHEMLASDPEASDASEDSDELPLASGPVVEPNPIQAPHDPAPAAAVVERAPAAIPSSLPSKLPTQLPTELKGEKKGASKP